MRLVQKRSVVFAGVMGLATGVLTGNSGLSPIVPISRLYPSGVRPRGQTGRPSKEMQRKKIRLSSSCEEMQGSENAISAEKKCRFCWRDGTCDRSFDGK
jgi:hypothetical protein